jgi:hypothetical protein
MGRTRDNKIDTMLSPPAGKMELDLTGVAFVVDPTLYPGFGLLRTHDPVHVSGVIEEVKSTYIT